ncbi:hypothetical protein LSTR_LSTR010841 [Laodelphax striatellus]|uniref:PDZ domain-containing protein n=1 Tax=Laodelphax striatellus TaxID=195883 RepID=A0A482WTC7_LAOST|nr:hypothetical protein LSTR_LSTR010841 [Laodelphax striatellus]
MSWLLLAVLTLTTASASAQQASVEECYSSAGLFGAILATLVITLALLAAAFLAWRIYNRTRKGKHLVLVTPDPEKGDFAFDNPVFREGTPIGRSTDKEEQKVGWPCWTPMSMLNKHHKPKAMDDSFLRQPNVMNVVPLRSHDFTGLGFNICGNMRDGIFVKDVLHRGPASESGRIVPGDRIESIQISFRHMVFEDAIAILGYASPYEVKLEVESPGPSSRPTTLLRNKRTSISPAERICHPFYRSQSIADLSKIRKPTDSHRMSPDHSITINDLSNGDLNRPAIIETSPIDKMQKFGVRVLPATPEAVPRPAEPEKHQNVRNSMIESTHHVQSAPIPASSVSKSADTVDGQLVEVDLTDGHHNVGNSLFFDEADQSIRKDSPSPATKESNMKSILAKGIQNLKEKLQPIVHKLDKDNEDKTSPSHSPASATNKKEMSDDKVDVKNDTTSNAELDSISVTEKNIDAILADKIGSQSVEISIPDEVHKAGMAARSNRKSIVEVERKRKDSSGGESSNEGESALTKKGKRKAPLPPQNSPKQESMEDEQVPETMSRAHNMDSADTDSEAGDRSGTTIELNDSHITVHHAADSESNRKAASLGDLSRIDDDQPIVMLERAVSLDLADGTPGGSKKRKAPLPPQGEEFSDEGGSPFSKPKGARMDNGNKARLKKSSDWGTLEDAVKCSSLSDDDTDAGISGCSTPEKSSDLIITSTPFRPTSPELIENKTEINSVHVSSCSWDLSVPDSSNADQFVTAVNGSALADNSDDNENACDTPPELPTSPVPTYITEIQVITTTEKSNADKVPFTDKLLHPSNNPKINVYNNYINSEHSSIDDNSLFSQSDSAGEISSEKTIGTTHFLLNDLTKIDGGEDNLEIKRQSLSFISEKTPTAGDTTCQVSISQPNSIDPLINQELMTTFKPNSVQQIPHLFSSENMSDEQILALKSSSPEPLVLDNGTSKVSLTKPDRVKNNVSVTSIKTSGSRIPVRAPEPMQRKGKKAEPASFVSFSSLNMSSNSDKAPYTEQNGTDHNSITHIFLDNSK